MTWRIGTDVPQVSAKKAKRPSSRSRTKEGIPKPSSSPTTSSTSSSDITSVGAIKKLDADTVFEEDDFAEPIQHALEKSAADGRWDLPEPAFLRWWRALPEEDRGEFVGVYGGDNVLARFVCALDYLTVMQARPQSGTTITDAYAIAAGLPSDSEAARRGAVAVWKHDAVQALLDRLRYRSRQQAVARITNRTTAVIESMLADATAEGAELVVKAKVVSTALAFMRMVSDEDVQERVERTKRGFVNARKALDVAKDELEEITPEQAKLHMKILREQLGEEAFRALASGQET